MSRIFAIIVALALAASCVPSREMKSELSHLESRLDAAPDSVLTVLDKMDRSVFLPRSTRAAYALLYSEALDKNGILVRSDSIIAPAVRYYNYHGSPDDKLKVFYYRGLIAENDGLPEDAMEWFKKAETNLSPASPCTLAGRLYSHKSTLYYNAYDYVDALENNRLAAEWFEKGEDYLDLAYRYTAIANNLACLKDYATAEEELSQVLNMWDKINLQCKADYFSNKLHILCQTKDTQRLIAELSNCRERIPNYDRIPQLNLLAIESFIACHKIDSSLALLSIYNRTVPEAHRPSNYYLTLSHLYEASLKYPQALDAAKIYLSIDGAETVKILGSDTKYIEERYESKLREIKEQQKTYISILIAIITIITAVVVSRILWNKLSLSERKFKEIKDEWDALNMVKEESTIVDSKSLESINQRLSLLDQVLLGHLSKNPVLVKKANAQIDFLLKDKEAFIVDTAKVFSASRPKFASWLSSYGLNEKEIGFCSLYIIGMYGKDSRPYFTKYECEALSNSIRSKLGLSPNGQKLKTYLREQFCKIENISYDNSN